MQNWIITELRNRGFRITPKRKIIASFITKNEGIFCAKQIIEKLPNIDETTIYRNLETLEKQEIIMPVIKIHGHQFYETNNENLHHHHLVCTECFKTECVTCNEPKIYNKNFKNINHLLIFTGICNNCNKI